MWRSPIFVFVSILHLSTSASLCGTSNDIPFHNDVPPMSSISPYIILTSVPTAHQSEIVTLRIKSVLSELKFGGFTVHALSTSRNEILGRFTSSRVGLKLGNCDNEDNIATYHAYPGGADDVELQWEAPNDYVGNIFFNATVAQDYDTFWVGITSNPLQVVQNEVSTLKSDGSSAAAIPYSQMSQLEVEPRNNALIYKGCGVTKTCVGFPPDCEEQQICTAVVTATSVDGRFFFELQSSNDGVGYVAMGLSRSHQMGDCSVMECVQENGTIREYTSWNFRRNNTREGVPQNITSLIESSFVNGTIYCKLERDPSTLILETKFNLQVERFHFLIANGRTFTDTSIGPHNLGRMGSAEPQRIIRQGIDPIYQGCGTNKICFGLPLECVAEYSCEAVVAVAVEDDQYDFELQSGVDGVAYVAFGLSSDTIMGDDSVIECIQENNTIRAYASWNTPHPSIGNTRAQVPQNIIELRNSSYVDGTIYCKVRREQVTNIRERKFHLAREAFHFMLAIGTTFGANAVSQHDLGHIVSPRTIELPGRAPYVRISAITIVAWILATSCSNFFRGL